MFRFENEYYLYGLAIIPLLVALYIYLQIRSKKRMQAYADSKLLEKLMPESSSGMQHLKFSLLMMALTCFIFALANPQIGSSRDKGTRKGVDIMMCLDISNSMLAEDVKPNRLDASKMAMSRFIDKLQGDRIGLVVFAGKSFVQLPITSDYAAAKMFINYVQPDLINEQGTDIASALDLAAVSMLPEDKDKKEKELADLTSKVILVVSDGEDHFPEAVEMSKEVNKLGITVHTIGIGSTRGEPIPIKGPNGTVNFKKDRDGNTIMTRLNETVLRDIAKAGKGVYVQANNANMGFETILDKINAMNKTDLQEITFTRYDSRFQIPLLVGIFFLVVEMFLFVTKSKLKAWLINKQNNLRMRTPIILILLMMAAGGLQAQTKDELTAIRRGNEDFKVAEQLRKEAMELTAKGGEINQRNANEKMKRAADQYQRAEVNYRKSMEATKSYDKAHYNLGNSLYRQGKYEDAAQSFEYVAKQESSSRDIRSRAFHNWGNSLLKQEKYEESIQAYKNALKMNPSDMDSKYNLEYAKKKLIQQQQQQQQNQDKNQEQQNQQQQQQQQGKDQKDQKKKQGDQPQPSPQQKDQQDPNKQQQPQPSAAQRQKEQDNKRQLDALQQNERNTKQKINQQEMQKGGKVHQEKDW